MKFILSAFMTLIVLVSLFDICSAQADSAVGEILEIGCKKSWRRAEGAKDQLLKKTRDVHRKVYVGESFLCEGTGVLKLVVRSVEIPLTEKEGWYPIPQNTEGNQPNTAGISHDEMAWLRGTYQLNTAESQVQGAEDTLAQLGNDKRVTQALVSHFKAPTSMALNFTGYTLNVQSSFKGFALIADGIQREESLADGSDLKLTACVENGKLVIESDGDSFKSEVKVEPQGDERLIITRKIFIDGFKSPVISRAVYDRQSLNGSRESFAGLTGGVPLGFENLELIAELQEPINTKDLSSAATQFNLVITKPLMFAGATIKGRISKTEAEPRDGAFFLNVQLDELLLSDGKIYSFSGTISRILAENEEVFASEAELAARSDSALNNTKTSAATASNHRSYYLGREITFPKKLKIIINFARLR